MDDEAVSQIGLRLETECFAGSASTKQTNTHQAQIVGILDALIRLLICSDVIVGRSTALITGIFVSLLGCRR